MIKTADMLYCGEEPPSYGFLAAENLKRAGVVFNAIEMPADGVLETLRHSNSDAVVLVSPFQFRGWMMSNKDALRALGKPVLAVIPEYTFGNSFPGYAQFENEAGDYADAYFCAQTSDALEFEKRGRKALPLGLWVDTDTFVAGPPLSERIQRFCFVGHVGDYWPGIYEDRRRILAHMLEAGLVDVLQIPRHRDTAHLVAHAYASYAGVFCPPANGRGHSIRTYEALACGAHVVEVQKIDYGSQFLGWGQTVSNYEDIDAIKRRMAEFPRADKHQAHICKTVRDQYNPPAVWLRMLAAADMLLS